MKILSVIAGLVTTYFAIATGACLVMTQNKIVQQADMSKSFYSAAAFLGVISLGLGYLTYALWKAGSAASAFF